MKPRNVRSIHARVGDVGFSCDYDEKINRYKIRIRLAKARWITIYRYRFLLECFLGRPLEATEVVHHKNGNSGDDRIENLEIKGNGEHVKEHCQLRRTIRICDVCNEGFECDSAYNATRCRKCYRMLLAKKLDRKDYWRRYHIEVGKPRRKAMRLGEIG